MLTTFAAPWWLPLKTIHIVSMVAWFSGLFYLPRLCVYHTQAIHEEGITARSSKRFSVMEHRLYRIIMWPAALLTTLTGLALLAYHLQVYVSAPWMHIKLTMIVLLWGYHLYSGHCIKQLQRHLYHTETFYRLFNEIPTVLLIITVSMVLMRPLWV